MLLGLKTRQEKGLSPIIGSEGDSAAPPRITGIDIDHRRKLYNGTIETQFDQFHGIRPGRDK